MIPPGFPYPEKQYYFRSERGYTDRDRVILSEAEIDRLMESLKQITSGTTRQQGSNSASIVLIERPDGMILVVTRGCSPQVGLPGGVIEPKEEPVSAAARELYEETGLRVDAEELEHLFTEKNSEGWTVHVYRADYDLVSKQVITPSDEGAAIWSTWDRTFDKPFGPFQYMVYERSRR